MADVARITLLAVIFLSVLIGSHTGHLGKFIESWRNLHIAPRILLTILVGWPIIGYTTPVLLQLWSHLTHEVIGLGGEYVITDRYTILFLGLIAITIIETTVITVKLSSIENNL